MDYLFCFCVLSSIHLSTASVNVALNKTASQSSTYQNYVAQYAVDGNATADWSVPTCCHTNTADPMPWWNVDLGESMTLEGFNIAYRTGLLQPARMSGFQLYVSNNSVDFTSGKLCHMEVRPIPPLIQYINCFVVGRYVVYFDPTTATGDLGPIIELCELEAFGCPNGYYGPDCTSSCTDGCESGICYPDNGICVYGCKPTWLGDKCDQVCMNDTWGAVCDQTCFCDVGTCIPSTGRCLEDKCRPGWQGIHCNEPCEWWYFGPSCNFICNCLHEDICNPVTGICPRGCMDGWKPDTCHEVCDANTYGPGCNSTCGACYNSTCDPEIGLCPGPCAPGWIGTMCKTPCQDGSFGMECMGRCHCLPNGTCDPATGFCPNGNCDRGWMGPTCSDKCPWNKFSYNCNETCHCADNQSCPLSYCNVGCAPGWLNIFCSEECDMYKYGLNCIQTCGHCKDNATCHHVTGFCSNGCEPGYQIDTCDTECPLGTFGDSCSQSCHCEVGNCDHVTGTCDQAGCQTGYMGPSCSEVCPAGQFGNDCLMTCHCLVGGCLPTDGLCIENSGCEAGWQGTSCSQECDSSTFGDGCTNRCGNCLEGAPCQHINGHCLEGCADGFQLPRCKRECDANTYGSNCAQTCGACNGSEPCDHESGVCLGLCEPGWTGLLCKTECNPGYYGHGCQLRCNCRNNTPCDRVVGTCPNGECDVGWTCATCSERCPLGTYSYNCEKKCNCLNGFCDPYDSDGVCPPIGCFPGWTGLACNEVCRNGTYGPSCTWNCGSCYADEPCDHIAGVCPTGCSPGYIGLTCANTCDNWWHGQDCASRCGYCYRDAICNPVTGVCPNGRCSSGWSGPTCTDACPATRYGEGCLSLCSENCVGQTCDRFNSSCTHGCISGYQGHDCTVPVPLRLVDDYWKEQTKLVLYIIAGILFLMAFLVILCCLRRRTLKERNRVPVELDIEEHAAKAGAVIPYQDITAEANGDKDNENIAETSLDDVPTDDQAALVDNQVDAVDDGPEPIVAPPTEILVEKEERDAADVDDEDDNDEDYPDGDVGKTDVDGTGTGAATAALAAIPAATAATKGNSNIPLAMTYGFALPEIVGTRILLSGFVTTVKNRKELGNLANEFKNLPEGQQRPVEVGKRPENKAKNRFRNILPYDHSRVVLEKEYGGNGYINASYIDGMDSERQYIATQGPKDDTVSAFWQMIWENNSGKVIMLANLIELGRPKCHQYWPNVSETAQYGNYVVTTMSEKEGSCFSTREIQLHRAQDKTMTRTIHQLHFTTWPDHGTPTVEQLLSFHSNSSNIQTPLQGPDVVHCSAGVGRTGTYIGLDALSKHGRYAASLDVYEYTLKMRKDRMNMIQTVHQYICLHEALAEGLPNATS